MKKTDAYKQEFVVGGNGRAVEALEPAIRAKVEAEFAERVRNASLWQRILLRRYQINAEVKRRLYENAPS